MGLIACSTKHKTSQHDKFELLLSEAVGRACQFPHQTHQSHQQMKVWPSGDRAIQIATDHCCHTLCQHKSMPGRGISTKQQLEISFDQNNDVLLSFQKRLSYEV